MCEHENETNGNFQETNDEIQQQGMDETKEDSSIFLEPRRLHPAGMFFSFIKIVKDTILGLGVGTIAIFKQSPTYGLLFIGVFVIFLIVNSILSWLRYTYRIEEGELRIEQGIIIRKKRYISLNRIHKIDLTANVIHRIFKLVKVQIDTASSGGGAEVSLSAIKTEDAHNLRRELKREKYQEQKIQHDTESEKKESTPYPTKKINWKRLFIAGSTSGSAGVILLAMLFLFSQTEAFIPEDVYSKAFQWIIQLSIVFMIVFGVFALILVYIFGIAGTMIKYGNFTIEKREKELFIKRGLLETKELTIPFDRIQAVQVDQSLIRQPLNYVQVSAIVAGGSFDSRESFPVIFPLMKKSEVNSFLQEFIPGYEDILSDVIPLGRKGRKYYMISAAILFVLALVPVAIYFTSFSWIPILFIFISLGYGMFAFKEAGHQIKGKRILFRYRGVWNKKSLMTFHRRIQTVEKSHHKLQQLEELASIEISLIGSGGMGTHFKLKHLENEEANRIGDWYSYRKDKLEGQTDLS